MPMKSSRHYQQQLIYQNASLVQSKYILDVTLKLKTKEVSEGHGLAYLSRLKTRISDEINFVICQSCFWCASCLSSQISITTKAGDNSASLAKCPSCVEGDIESIPIA